MTTNKKRGRKPLPPGQARTRTLGVAFTEAEYEALTCRALATGRTLADVVREGALEPFILRPVGRGLGDVGAGTTRRSA